MSNPFTYRDSPIISEDKQSIPTRDVLKEQRAVLQRFRQGPVAGALAPVVILTEANSNEPVSLLDCFGHSFVVLYFCTGADAGLPALREVTTDLPDIPVALYLVVPKPPTTSATDAVCVLLDGEGKGTSAYNAGPRTLYLVRPDRHIAARHFESYLGELPMLLRYTVREKAKVGQGLP